MRLVSCGAGQAEQGDIIVRQPVDAISEGERILLPFRGPERHINTNGPSHNHLNADIIFDGEPLKLHIFFPDDKLGRQEIGRRNS